MTTTMRANLEQLCDFLDGDDNQHGLDFVATHGFLCATVAGPALEDWLSHLFEGQQDKVPSIIIEQIGQWRLELEQELADDETIDFPVEVDELSMDSEFADWAIGFVDAIFLNEKIDWFEKDEEAVTMLTLPMIVFSGIEDDNPELNSIRTNEQLLEEMAESMMDNVSKLYLLFHAPDHE